MAESYIIYNPLAGNGRCENAARQLKKTFLPGARLQSMVVGSEMCIRDSPLRLPPT